MIAITKPPPTTQPHLSFSQVRQFGACPLSWALRVFKAEQVSSSMKFGSAFHHSVAAHLQGKLQGQALTRDELLTEFDVAWNSTDADVPIRFNKGESLESLRTLAGAMIDAFLGVALPGKVLAIEQPFSCKLAPDVPIFCGYIDAITVEEDALVVTDFKTASRRPSEDPEDLDPAQLLTYGIGLAKIGFLREFSRLPLRLQYTFILKSKKPEVITIPITPSRKDADAFIEKARVISRCQEQGLIYPNPGWHCASCGHQERCKRWPADMKGG